MKRLFTCILTLIGLSLCGNSIYDTLFINAGTLPLVDSTPLKVKTFNSSPEFSDYPALLQLQTGDTLLLTIINQDILAHQLLVGGMDANQKEILAGDSTLFQITSERSACFQLKSTDDSQRYLGLSTQIAIYDFNRIEHAFFWNMHTHQSTLNENVANGSPFVKNNYEPDYYTVNNRSNPHINQDVNARITGQVGDTILVFMANTGMSLHSIHLHGYHAHILFSDKYPDQVGWYKDTFQSHPGHNLVLQIVPDKPGEYPIHDHNLAAVTGGMYYPTEWFLQS